MSSSHTYFCCHLLQGLMAFPLGDRRYGGKQEDLWEHQLNADLAKLLFCKHLVLSKEKGVGW